MLFKIRASDWTNLPVDFSTGKFGALQVIKVFAAGPHTTEKAAKDFGKAYVFT